MDHGEGQSMVHDTRTLAWISRTLETLVLDENANSAQNPVSSSGGLESSASNLISFGLFGAGVLVGMFAGSMLAKSR